MESEQIAAPVAVTQPGPALSLPPGPVRDRLTEAFAHIPDRPREVLALASEARAAALAAGDDQGAAWALALTGYAHFLLSDHHTALEAFAEALAALESLGDLAGRAGALDGLASVHTSLGHYEDAVALAQQSLALARALGRIENEAWTLHGMANLMLDLEDPDQALVWAAQAMERFDALDWDSGRARALVVIGGAHRSLGHLDRAREALETALALARDEGAQMTEARVLDDLGRVDADAGRYPEAVELYAEALRLRERVGNRQAQATSRLHMGMALTALGRQDEAIETLTVGLALARDTGAAPRESEIHHALAAAYEASGDPVRALAHLRLYQEGRERMLSAQARSRVETLQMRAEAERAQRDAEIARMRTAELGAANRELEATLDRLRQAQSQLVQAEKMASLGRLSAGLAHEIRNPLHFVLNFSEVAAGLARDVGRRLREPDVPPALVQDTGSDLAALVDSAERVQVHARRAEGVVQSLVGHARQTRAATRGPVQLADVLDAIVAEARPEEVGIRVEQRFSPALAPVEGDATALRQALTAVVANALWVLTDHPPAGDPPTLVLLASEVADSAGGAVEVTVIDNGPGIAPEHHDRIFEPFFTTRAPGQGTGLGLALAYDAVVAGHGGQLTVSSHLGRGATFTVRLPLRNGTAPAAADS